MTDKIKKAIEGLEDGRLCPEPFSALSAPDSIRTRIQLARRALRLIAGEDEGSPKSQTARYPRSSPEMGAGSPAKVNFRPQKKGRVL